MKPVEYIEVNYVVKPTNPWSDLLIAELGELGYESFEETTAGFKAYIQSDIFNKDLLEQVSIPEDTQKEVQFSFKWRKITSKNWNQEWEKHFEPVDIQNTCYIRAPFHEPRSHYRFEIVIEPKMSFGTGHHHTTALMVEWMLETDLEQKTVLDMGCGTGVLAILAYKMKAKQVDAIDNYPFAYENTLENIQNNQAQKINVFLGDAALLDKKKYDTILANITRNVLLQDMQTYTSALKKGGSLLLSGFLWEDKKMIEDSARNSGLLPAGHKKKQEWAALKFVNA
ncbi:MAG: 50S ribosomal protein L11 methyltransferase [Bacteroidota bacterium]